MQKEIEKIIREISHKHNIPKKDIEEAIKAQFAFVREVIESAEKDIEETFKIVQLPLFGKFLVKKNKIKHIINKKNGIRS